jgi:hypothetical protein
MSLNVSKTAQPLAYMVVIKRGKNGVCLASFEKKADADQYIASTAKHLYRDLDSRYDYTTASKLVLSYGPSNTYVQSSGMLFVEKKLYPRDYLQNSMAFHNQKA